MQIPAGGGVVLWFNVSGNAVFCVSGNARACMTSGFQHDSGYHLLAPGWRRICGCRSSAGQGQSTADFCPALDRHPHGPKPVGVR